MRVAGFADRRAGGNFALLMMRTGSRTKAPWAGAAAAADNNTFCPQEYGNALSFKNLKLRLLPVREELCHVRLCTAVAEAVQDQPQTQAL